MSCLLFNSLGICLCRFTPRVTCHMSPFGDVLPSICRQSNSIPDRLFPFRCMSSATRDSSPRKGGKWNWIAGRWNGNGNHWSHLERKELQNQDCWTTNPQCSTINRFQYTENENHLSLNENDLSTDVGRLIGTGVSAAIQLQQLYFCFLIYTGAVTSISLTCICCSISSKRIACCSSIRL